MTRGIGFGGKLAALACWVTLALGAAPAVAPAVAGQLDGVAMPDALVEHGVALRLNGMGVRTYSIFAVHIYVAGLYLPQPSRDAEAIMHSQTPKLLTLHFVHDVTADRARAAWRDGFNANCRAPCVLAPDLVRQFLAAVPAFRPGDESTLVFSGNAVEFRINGRTMGTIDNANFTRTVLANFIGARGTTDRLRSGLLGLVN